MHTLKNDTRKLLRPSWEWQVRKADEIQFSYLILAQKTQGANRKDREKRMKRDWGKEINRKEGKEAEGTERNDEQMEKRSDTAGVEEQSLSQE